MFLGQNTTENTSVIWLPQWGEGMRLEKIKNFGDFFLARLVPQCDETWLRLECEKKPWPSDTLIN